MAVSNYSTNPDENTTISGINIGEGCPPSGLNNAIRQLMADVKVESDDVGKATSAAQEAAAAAQTAADEAKQNTVHAQSADSAISATSASSAANATKWNGAAKTVSSAAASGGADGDLWFQYV